MYSYTVKYCKYAPPPPPTNKKKAFVHLSNRECLLKCVQHFREYYVQGIIWCPYVIMKKDAPKHSQLQRYGHLNTRQFFHWGGGRLFAVQYGMYSRTLLTSSQITLTAALNCWYTCKHMPVLEMFLLHA